MRYKLYTKSYIIFEARQSKNQIDQNTLRKPSNEIRKIQKPNQRHYRIQKDPASAEMPSVSIIQHSQKLLSVKLLRKNTSDDFFVVNCQFRNKKPIS